jgi:hypothetical protein
MATTPRELKIRLTGSPLKSETMLHPYLVRAAIATTGAHPVPCRPGETENLERDSLSGFDKERSTLTQMIMLAVSASFYQEETRERGQAASATSRMEPTAIGRRDWDVPSIGAKLRGRSRS